jgi:multidrug efflux pump subunit AcrB
MTTQIRHAGIVHLFVRHPNAANLLMAVLVVMGLFSVGRLNTQFFPSLEIPIITVKVVWPGASAADAEKSILQTLEPELRFLDGLDDITSVAREGSGFISLEFKPGSDMNKALSDVEMAVAGATSLPTDAEEPVIKRVAFYEPVAKLLVTGPWPETALNAFARQIRDGLLKAGIDRVTLTGARDEELRVTISPRNLQRYDLTVSDIASRINQNTQDRPSGTLKGAVDKQLRTAGKEDTASALGRIEIRARANGERVLLRDIATIADTYDPDGLTAFYEGHQAIQLEVRRALSADTLKTARILDDYVAGIRSQLPRGLKLVKYDVRASYLSDRINLLLRNGVSGLVLVLVILFIFLNARIAFWVALGIPVAMMTTVVVMWVSGQSVNMVSLFAMILTLGIIVDDAIVVGEHTATRFDMGDTPQVAAERGAGRMLAPVVAATLTTQVAFLPTFFMGGRIGDIMVAMPYVVISVLFASLIECFLILPAHLRHTLRHARKQPSRFRQRFDAGFARFRDGPFRRFVALAFRWRYTTLATAIAMLLLAVALIPGGWIKFHFFPTPEPETITASIVMVAGTPRSQTMAAIKQVEEALAATEKKLTGGKEKLVVTRFSRLGKLGRSFGDNLAWISVELTASEIRTVRTRAIVKAWKKALPRIPGAERIAVGSRRTGPPGRDIDIRLSGGRSENLKSAALAIEDQLTALPGITGVSDDLPYGKQDVVLELTPRGAALGFNLESIGKQVRAAFEGTIARRFARDSEEVTIRVIREQSASGTQALRSLRVRSPSGEHVLLDEVVSLHEKPGFSLINRRDGKNTIAITADVDLTRTTAAEALDALLPGLKAITAKYHLDYDLAGRAEEQRESFVDLKLGGMIALVLIYIILAWVFASYSRPLIVMTVIPFGFVGAVAGHLIMGFALTILSVIGMLGLAGIIVNDSIILVSQVDERLDRGQTMSEAAIGAAGDRLRAVLLTSLTTIGGLLPLMFEKSLQAQFLLPMAITIVFGLAVVTILVLVIVPASLGVLEDIARLFGRVRAAPDVKSGSAAA